MEDARFVLGAADVFEPDDGACSACHGLDSRSNEPERSMFTDYGYDTMAAPRNRALPRGA